MRVDHSVRIRSILVLLLLFLSLDKLLGARNLQLLSKCNHKPCQHLNLKNHNKKKLAAFISSSLSRRFTSSWTGGSAFKEKIDLNRNTWSQKYNKCNLQRVHIPRKRNANIANNAADNNTTTNKTNNDTRFKKGKDIYPDQYDKGKEFLEPS